MIVEDLGASGEDVVDQIGGEVDRRARERGVHHIIFIYVTLLGGYTWLF